MLKNYAILCCAYFVVVKGFAHFWLYQPIHNRPAPVRYNEVLRLLDFTAQACLVAAFFLLLSTKKLIAAALVVVVLLAYDAVVRYFFLEREARRMRDACPKWSLRHARRVVKRRALRPMFH